MVMITICVWINSKCLITNNIKITDFINLMEDKDILLSRYFGIKVI